MKISTHRFNGNFSLSLTLKRAFIVATFAPKNWELYFERGGERGDFAICIGPFIFQAFLADEIIIASTDET